MIVHTITGKEISLIDTDKRYLYDSTGGKWERYPQLDSQDPLFIGYIETKDRVSKIQLTRGEMKRIINGIHAMMTPTTVEEMRFHVTTLPKDYQTIIDMWPDQTLREILMESEERHQNPGVILETRAYTIIEAEEAARAVAEEQGRTESLRKAPSGPEKGHSISRGYSGTTRRRTQEGSISVAFGEASVILTPKQLEFMERLSECPGWKETGTEGEYVASQYAEELSDSMNPMAMGAVLTTLREKGLVTTKKERMGGIKCCIFQLTADGAEVYKSLAGGRG